MRFIDLDLLVGRSDTQPLIDAADSARKAILEAADEDARRKLIEAHRGTWVAFRPCFETIFGAKCWYTESKNPGADDDIDHFRPKGRLAEDSEHGGYWWEALHWRNFRLSCHHSNRLRRHPSDGVTQGKGDHFPILAETDRWRRHDETHCECPVLLDPTDPEDPPLLTFDPDGYIALSPQYEGCESAVTRVEASRIYLNLDWPAFVEDRRDLYANIYRKVSAGDVAYSGIARKEAGARDSLKSVVGELIRLTRDNAEYSRAANAYILRFRDRDWVKKCVIPHIPSF